MNASDKNKGFYGVDCIKCGTPIFLNHYGTTVPDVEMPESAIRCPYCDDRCVYTQDRLVYYQRLKGDQ